MMHIRPLSDADISWIEQILSANFGSSRVVSRGVLHDALTLPGFVAVDDEAMIGLVQYHIKDRDFEVVTLITTRPRTGVGRSLIDSVIPVAQASNCQRLWLITTNNNSGAIAFYRAIGWKQVAVYPNALEVSRRLKPEISEFDSNGIPIKDEIEFELRLSSS